MATTKSVKKAPASVKRAPAPTAVSAAKARPAPKAVAATRPEPATKAARPRARKSAKVSAEQRRNYVEVAAFYIAERRGFAAGDPLQDWVQAETEIDRLIAEGLLGT